MALSDTVQALQTNQASIQDSVQWIAPAPAKASCPSPQSIVKGAVAVIFNCKLRLLDGRVTYK